MYWSSGVSSLSNELPLMLTTLMLQSPPLSCTTNRAEFSRLRDFLDGRVTLKNKAQLAQIDFGIDNDEASDIDSIGSANDSGSEEEDVSVASSARRSTRRARPSAAMLEDDGDDDDDDEEDGMRMQVAQLMGSLCAEQLLILMRSMLLM
jgi:hypothetical protein